MAEVYRAEDLHLRREVAVKLFQPNPGPLTWQRFGEEARVLAQLSHPALVSIYDAGMDGARPFLVMRLVPGGNLNQRLLTGPLTPAQVVRIGTALAEALDHVHGRGIVHRDIKPSNILMGHEDEPHLADFGIAHLAGAVRLTRSGEVVGTAAYLAPEQLTSGVLTPANDVYGLGLVLLECLTGELAFPGVSQAESALARLHRRPDIPAAVPSGLAALLEAMTAADPAQRPSAYECAGVLRALDTGSPAYAALAVVRTPDLAVTPAPNQVPLPHMMATPGMVSAAHPGGTPLSETAVTPSAKPTRTYRTPFVHRRMHAFVAAAGFVVAVVAGLALMLGSPGAGSRQPPGQATRPGPGVPVTSVTSVRTAPAMPAPNVVAAITTSPAAAPPTVAGPPVGSATQPKHVAPGKAKGHGGGKGSGSSKPGK
jgi:hypothetical protein